MRVSKEGESSGWVFEVEVLEECGGLIMGPQVLQNQPGSSLLGSTSTLKKRFSNALHTIILLWSTRKCISKMKQDSPEQLRAAS